MKLPRIAGHWRPSLLCLEARLAPATFTVNNTADSGNGSLRKAVADANGLGGPDTITFDATTFSTQKTINLSTGVLTLTDTATITGPAAGVKISGSNLSRVFSIAGDGTK